MPGSANHQSGKRCDMRAVYMFCALLMLAFTGVQYNDPDGVWWGLIYLVPTVWALIAAFRPNLLAKPQVKRLLWISVAAGLVGVIFYWPDVDNWWLKEVWWVEETAREGMGMMIDFAVLVLVALTTRSHQSSAA